jgi:hypothetical protein
MKRVYLNFIIDLSMFLSISGLALTGVIQKWVLPPARGTRRGLGPETLLGWTRHDWGDLHFWAAVILVILLVIHIILHWKWIVCRFRELFGAGRKKKNCETED